MFRTANESLLPSNASSRDENTSFASKIEATVQGLFPTFRFHSFVSYLSLTQIFVFLSTWLYSLSVAIKSRKYSDILQVSQCTLYYFGASNASAVRYGFQFHRLLLPIFLHAGFFHLFVNVFSQIQLLLIIEQTDLLTPKLMIAFYFCCGVAATLGSMTFKPRSVSVGASGALFGLFGFVCRELCLDGIHWRKK